MDMIAVRRLISMSQFLGGSFHKSIVEQIAKSTRSITNISLYVTLQAVNELSRSLPTKIKKRSLVTVPPGAEYVNGSKNVAALELLSQHGFEMRWLPDLHEKIYFLDEKFAFIGLKNFTKKEAGNWIKREM